MRYRISFSHHSIASIAAAVCILLLLSSVPISEAQSGRRPPKQPSSPDPLQPKPEEPPIKPTSDNNSAPKIPIKVVWNHSYISSSTIYSRTVQEACLERLSQSGSVRATTASDEMNRKEAIDLAKASTDTYVLWFELEPDSAYNNRGGIGSVPPQYLNVRFEVYTPATGKTKTGGHIYQRPQGPGGLPLPGPGTSGSAIYSLGYAGREMADLALDALGISRPR
ncbi:MAG TPA: hypothetical protein VLG74_10785 [Blastocatellia bacterium]|nr:hypothetical protein [Blastocatellia bacterium]